MLLVRHGQSTWNHEHRIQGQLDPPLSDEGRRQAARLGRRLAGRKFSGFYSSDLKRALETSRVIGEAVGIEPTPMAGLREIYLGEWEGLLAEELAVRYPKAWAGWTEEPDWDLVPGGEGSAPFEARVKVALDSLFDSHQQGDVLAVTHGGVIQIALHHVVGRPGRGIFPFRIQNTSMSVIEKRNGRLVVSGVNDIGHLEVGTLGGLEIG
ncbi:MAG TPA: histidine phosphatase family protein [Candidatus Dormibacteraeota bacterium]